MTSSADDSDNCAYVSEEEFQEILKELPEEPKMREMRDAG